MAQGRSINEDASATESASGAAAKDSHLCVLSHTWLIGLQGEENSNGRGHIRHKIETQQRMRCLADTPDTKNGAVYEVSA